MKRAFLIVLDSVGIGAARDAAEFGDSKANTLKRISKSNKFSIPTLIKMGLGNIEGVDYIEKCDTPLASYASLEELSRGKDTTTGHWEIAGIVSESPMPTYPNGFPKEIIDAFSRAIERDVLCNLPYSGTQVIEDYGEEHVRESLSSTPRQTVSFRLPAILTYYRSIHYTHTANKQEKYS